MRSFSALRAFCSHMESFPEKPHPRRDAAAALGTRYHEAVELWARTGGSAHFDSYEEPLRSWLLRMREVWTPPEDLETELALGLEDLPFPRYVPVKETEPHVYVPKDGKTPLLTAGRADLLWVGADGVARVADIKTGQFYLGDPAKVRQILAQGFAAASMADAVGFIPGVYYARTGHFDWGHEQVIRVSGEDFAMSEPWRMVLEASKRDTAPHAGPHCLGCWERKQCNASPVIESAA